jgi:GTP-binding protein Era
MNTNFKSGFIAIMGSLNVGKSTLMNLLVGQKVSIVSDKAQTTRNKVVGIRTKENYQMIFLDTPGIQTPRNRLGEYMLNAAYSAGRDVDAVLMLVDATMGIRQRDEEIIKKLKGDNFLLAINKTDATSSEKVNRVVETAVSLGVNRSDILNISALHDAGVDALEKRLCEYLIPGPMYYPLDMITDRPERFIAAELIREKALNNLQEEVPHGIGVEIEKVEEAENLTSISAVIYCEKTSHKGIIIGKGGRMLKKIGTEARADLELLFGTKVFLEIFVKVKDRWRDSMFMLKELGYREGE